MSATLGDTREHHPMRPAASSRATGAVLTALLLGVFAFLASLPVLYGLPVRMFHESVAQVLSDAPSRIVAITPVTAHLIRPQSQSVALPTYTIAPDTPIAKAELPATAATSSPLDAGAPAGTGVGAGIKTDALASGAPASCLDMAWMRAVTRHIALFFYYPVSTGRYASAGVVYVHFLVGKDGRLMASDVATSSGSPILDSTALDIVRRANPLPAIPDRMHVTEVDALLPIGFGNVHPHFNPSSGNCVE
jgi:TonB family protein